ncbi:MAG: flagellar hook capping FlgD N-terminal domain-containing protein [Syntrophobacter sp.]
MADSSTIQGLGSNIITPSASTATSGTSSANSLNFNSFLTLFTTQLQHQDPNNPMESYELASQLAQFSTVAKLTEATSLLTNIQNYAVAINNSEMSSLVGKDVAAQKSTMDVTSDSVSSLKYTLDSPSTVTITVSDSDGNVVYTGSKGNLAAGTYDVGWDGKNTNGKRVSDGTYSVAVSATDASETVTNPTTFLKGTVSTCTLDNTNPYYTLSSGEKVSVASVYKIATAGETN